MRIEKKNIRSCSSPVRMFVVALALLLMSAYQSPLYAHPADSLSLAYDAKAQSLSVAITHSTSFPSKHYIKNVSIMNNGRNVGSEQYTSQPSKDSFTYTYSVPAKPGDKISIKTTCSIFGSKEAELAVP